ncbi:hypothetical protein MMC10_000326 [Thelotrema lepadinum]|nr:hypothetical protein [Thelotrema lepadinum]
MTLLYRLAFLILINRILQAPTVHAQGSPVSAITVAITTTGPLRPTPAPETTAGFNDITNFKLTDTSFIPFAACDGCFAVAGYTTSTFGDVSGLPLVGTVTLGGSGPVSSPAWASSLTGPYVLFSAYSLVAYAPQVPSGTCYPYSAAGPELSTPFLIPLPSSLSAQFLSSAETAFASFIGTEPCQSYETSLNQQLSQEVIAIASASVASALSLSATLAHLTATEVTQNTTTTTSPTRGSSSSTASPTSSPDSRNQSGLSYNGKVALGVALPLGILFLAAGGMLFLRRYRKGRLGANGEHAKEKDGLDRKELDGRPRHELDGRGREELEAEVGQELQG